MRIRIRIGYIIIVTFILNSCNNVPRQRIPKNFTYRTFRDSIKVLSYDSTSDSNNIFDSTLFTPGIDSLNTLLKRIGSSWHNDIDSMERIDTILKIWKKAAQYTAEDLLILKENIKVLDSFIAKKEAASINNCREKDCLLFAEIIKSTQTLYLYLDTELMDSFPVSTGMGKYETSNMSVRPSGPLFIKYNSKKFPGGNYQGLGNMPYAVFIRGGYAIHGTTKGNFAKLGSRASHGCIRLHPVNAKIFYELVKRIGLHNTWVSIKDSLP